MDAVVVSLPVLAGLIALALLFDFINGLHDAANSIATIVSTRALTPRIALALAAVMNFVGHVLQTIHDPFEVIEDFEGDPEIQRLG